MHHTDLPLGPRDSSTVPSPGTDLQKVNWVTQGCTTLTRSLYLLLTTMGRHKVTSEGPCNTGYPVELAEAALATAPQFNSLLCPVLFYDVMLTSDKKRVLWTFIRYAPFKGSLPDLQISRKLPHQ